MKNYSLILFFCIVFPTFNINATPIFNNDSINAYQAYKNKELNADTLFKISLKEYNNQQYTEAISAAKSALEIVKAEKNDKKQAEILEYLGIYYAEFSDYQNSIKNLFQSLTIAENLNDLKSINSKYFNIGTTFIEAGNYKKGIHFIKKSLDFYDKNDTKKLDFVIAGYANLGVAYNELNLLDSALFYYQIAANIARQEKYTKHIGAPLLNIGEIHLKKGDYKKANEYFNLALNAFKISKDNKGISHTKQNIAELYFIENKYDDAIYLFNEIIPFYVETNDLNYLEKSYEILSNLYENKDDYSKALAYKKLLINVKDSISKSEIISKISELETQYRIQKLVEENNAKIDLLEEKKKTNTLKWYASTFILLIIIILIITLYKKNKTQKDFIEIRLEKTKLEQDKLKSELSYRNKELENFALHIVQKNEFLVDIKNSLKKVKHSSDSKNNEDVKNLLFKITQALRINKELEDFQIRVDEVNNAFLVALTNQFPDLTEKEKRLCVLLKLNLTSKEIASLNNVSEGAITMARYRLRKKLNLNSDDNLTDFFQNSI